MKDSVVQVTVSGIAGAFLMNIAVYVLNLLGIKVTTPWSIGADAFLTGQYVNTMSGIFIGLIVTVALNIAAAWIILLLFRWTGYDYAVLKGIIGTTAFSFVTMGLFMPLLNIAPRIHSEPLTNIVALLVLTVTGTVMALILKAYRPQVINQ